MKPIHTDCPLMAKEVRRQLALSQEDLARAQLDAFCERMQKEGFLVLSAEQDSI